MLEVFINRTKIDIQDTNIKYVKQVNDLADVTTVNASYSYSLTVKKTPKNTAIFQGLGLVGDTSTIPYTKNLTQVIDNGSMIIPNGVSYVKETSKTYKLVIQDGIIDFFRIIENKTLGNELDLSELSHTKTAASIIASFTNDYYRYLISEYNGWTVKANVLNPDYQIPSINLKYIFDKVMDFAGYTYEGLPDISGEWQTYPSPPAIPEDEDTLIFTGQHFGAFNTTIGNDPNDNDDWKELYDPHWDSVTVYDTSFITLENNWRFKVVSTGNYSAEYNIAGDMLYGVLEGNIFYTLRMPLKYSLYVNNVKVSSAFPAGGTTTTRFALSAGQKIRFYPETLTRQEAEDRGITDERFLTALNTGNFEVAQIVVTNLNVTLKAQGIEIFDFGEALKDYSMTDFIKEVMFRKSLTPFPDVNAKHIVFKTLTQRVDPITYVDWSDKYIERDSELYSFGDYAISNSLLMKHDDKEGTFGNGSLTINNVNLKDNQNLFQSNYYSPSGELVLIRNIFQEFFYLIRFWDREVKDDDGTQTIEYKPLKNRFFLLKEQTVNKSLNIGGITVTSFPKAIITGTMMNDVVSQYYFDFDKIFDNLRIHNIKIAIGSYEMSTLQMDIPYYFRQEASMYILNKLSYESGKTAIGEFLKIKT